MLALVAAAAVVVVDVGTAVAAELVAMSATDANDNDGRTVVDDGVDVDDDAAAAVDNPSYPASAISPLSTI